MSNTNRKKLEGIRANRKKLDSCPVHNFGELPKQRPITSQYITCKNCGGALRVCDILNYRRGYKAAGKNPNDVMVILEEEHTN